MPLGIFGGGSKSSRFNGSRVGRLGDEKGGAFAHGVMLPFGQVHDLRVRIEAYPANRNAPGVGRGFDRNSRRVPAHMTIEETAMPRPIWTRATTAGDKPTLSYNSLPGFLGLQKGEMFRADWKDVEIFFSARTRRAVRRTRGPAHRE